MAGARLNCGIGVWRLAAITVVAGASTVSADAHLVQTGFGTFYDGVVHLLITPTDLLVVIGFGLLAGLGGKALSRGVLLVLPATWMVGGLAGMTWPVDAALPWLTSLTFGLVGVMIAANVHLPVSVGVGLAVLAGGLHGFINGATMAPGGADWLALTGAAVLAFTLVTLSAAIVASLHAPWTRVVVRVAGSWMTAIAMLMIGWLARGGF